LRLVLVRLAAALLLPLVGCTTGVPYEPPSRPLVLRGVTVIDGTGREPTTDLDVVIEGERIVGIHASRDRSYPSGWQVLDLPGLYVMPGLIDTHAHVTVLFFHQEADGTRRTEYRRDLSERVLRILLAHGVTTVRNPSAPAELITYHTKFFGDDPRWTEHADLALIPEIAARWREGRTWVADWTPEDFARARSLWPKMEALIRRYHEGGVLLAAGSDLPNAWTIPGVSLHEELELLVNAGIPASEVIRIATRNGAETLGLLDELGTVEVGKRADLLVLSADPTADIRNTRSIEAVIQGGDVLRPAELLGGPDATTGLVAGAGSDRLRPAQDAVPWDSVERGIGVVAFREPHGSGAPRIDTLRVREQPSSNVPFQAMVVFDERGPGGWYTVLAAPGVRSNMVEIDYEELAVPFDSLTGSWARVIYGQSAAGHPLQGWIDTNAGGVRTLRWADLLPRYMLFLADPETAAFHHAPGGARLDIRLAPPNASEADYDLESIATAGEWMQVRVTVPSRCSGEPGSTEQLAWIRYLTSRGRPLLWPRTRGC
jgi:cytosine/adenosine deaminase-related metal-dependent hydrolase